VKPGRLQLTVAFSLLALAIAYNVWMFSRPSRRPSTQAVERPLLESLQAGDPTVTGEPASQVIDPRTIPPVPDVDLGGTPEWPRNPFVNVRLALAGSVPAQPVAVVAAEPELVVASILHSSQRQLAIINGRIVRVGDRIGSATIRDIEPRAVVVESTTGSRQRLELRVPFGSGRLPVARGNQ
jgi:hypothetical protein